MFKVVPDYEFMMINKEGVVKSSNTGNILKPFTDKDGYFRVKVWCPVEKKLKGCYIHRALAKAFIHNPDPDVLTQVNHKNSKRKDNSLENLEWVSPKGNYEHGVAFGKILVGVEGCNIKHDDALIHEIARLLEIGKSVISISRELSVPRGTIQTLKSGDSRKDIMEKYNIPPVKKNLTDETVSLIVSDLFDEKLSNKDIETKYNLNRGVLTHILKGNTFKHITSKIKDWDKVQRSRYNPVGSK